MTTYRLPAELGGIEVREAGKRGDGRLILVPVAPELAEFDWEFCLNQSDLTEIEPPLPPEPDAVAVVLGGRVWVRSGFPGGEYHWEAPGFHGHSWLALNQLSAGVPIVPLVPDPVAYAPELPFALDSCKVFATVAVNRDNAGSYVAICAYDPNHEEPERYTPEEAERVAAAILRAAREARKAEGGAA